MEPVTEFGKSVFFSRGEAGAVLGMESGVSSEQVSNIDLYRASWSGDARAIETVDELAARFSVESHKTGIPCEERFRRWAESKVNR